jgi:hypothetical protein
VSRVAVCQPVCGLHQQLVEFGTRVPLSTANCDAVNDAPRCSRMVRGGRPGSAGTLRGDGVALRRPTTVACHGSAEMDE